MQAKVCLFAVLALAACAAVQAYPWMDGDGSQGDRTCPYGGDRMMPNPHPWMNPQQPGMPPFYRGNPHNFGSPHDESQCPYFQSQPNEKAPRAQRRGPSKNDSEEGLATF